MGITFPLGKLVLQIGAEGLDELFLPGEPEPTPQSKGLLEC